MQKVRKRLIQAVTARSIRKVRRRVVTRSNQIYNYGYESIMKCSVCNHEYEKKNAGFV